MGHRATAWRPGDGLSSSSAEKEGSTSRETSDPRLLAALEAYLEACKAGRRPDRQEFLSRYAEVSGELVECLEGLELVESAAGALPMVRPIEEPLAPSTVLGDFRIVRELGRGGMGVVYEAVQLSLGRRVALKVLPFAAALDPRQRQRFQVEAQAAAHLHHTNIVPVFAVGSDRGSHYYAMQFIEGRTLAGLISELRAMGRDLGERAGSTPASAGEPAAGESTTAAVSSHGSPMAGATGARPVRPGSSTSRRREHFLAIARLGAQAAEGLDHAHALGILHRDVKPGNLMVDAIGNLWVTDFGLARFLDEPGLTRSGDVVGTVRYMSPEQAAGGNVVDQRADIYSLGATLYELATLRPLHAGQDRRELLRQITHDDPIPPRRIDPNIPRDLETIILKAVSKEPHSRYPTTRALADDLWRFVEDRPVQARRPGPIEQLTRWSRKHRVFLNSVAAALLLAVTAAGGVAWHDHRQLTEKNTQFERANSQLQKANERLRQALAHHEEGRQVAVAALDSIAQTAMQGFYTDGPKERARNEKFATYVLGFYEQELPFVKDDPGLAILTNYRIGFILADLLQRQDRAEPYFRRGMDLFREKRAAGNPLNGDAALNASHCMQQLAGILSARNELEEAIRLYGDAAGLVDDLLEHQPEDLMLLHNSVQDHSLEAWLLWAAGKRDESRLAVERLLDRLDDQRDRLSRDGSTEEDRSRLSSTYSTLGRIVQSCGEMSMALRAAEAASSLQPDLPEALNDVAWVLASRAEVTPEEARRAVELAKRAVGADPYNPLILNTLGMAHHRAGDEEAAEEALKRSMDGNRGGTPTDWLAMVLIELGKGRVKEARDWYDKAGAWFERHGQSDSDACRLFSEASPLLLQAEGKGDDAEAPAERNGGPPAGE